MSEVLALVIDDLETEVGAWRDLAAQYDAATPDELQSAIWSFEHCIKIGEWGYWGLYALEGLFGELGIRPGDDLPKAVDRVLKAGK